jgi:hypothetical protein
MLRTTNKKNLYFKFQKSHGWLLKKNTLLVSEQTDHKIQDIFFIKPEQKALIEILSFSAFRM